MRGAARRGESKSACGFVRRQLCNDVDRDPSTSGMLSFSVSFFLSSYVIIAVITSRRKLSSMTCARPRSRLRYLRLVMCELVRFERQKNPRSHGHFRSQSLFRFNFNRIHSYLNASA